MDDNGTNDQPQLGQDFWTINGIKQDPVPFKLLQKNLWSIALCHSKITFPKRFTLKLTWVIVWHRPKQCTIKRPFLKNDHRFAGYQGLGLFNRYKVGHILVEVVHPIYNWFSGAHLEVVGRRFFCVPKDAKPPKLGGGGQIPKHIIHVYYVFFLGPVFLKWKTAILFFSSFNNISSFLHLFPACWQNISIQFGAHIFLVPLEHF